MGRCANCSKHLGFFSRKHDVPSDDGRTIVTVCDDCFSGWSPPLARVGDPSVRQPTPHPGVRVAPPNPHGIGCPLYKQGICAAGSGDVPCNLAEGSYETSCHVYNVSEQRGAAGLRVCVLCGIQWRSRLAAMKDMSWFGPHNQPSALYDRSNVCGLTCTRCGKSFCIKCLPGGTPSELPGGACPLCAAKLHLA